VIFVEELDGTWFFSVVIMLDVFSFYKEKIYSTKYIYSFEFLQKTTNVTSSFWKSQKCPGLSF